MIVEKFMVLYDRGSDLDKLINQVRVELTQKDFRYCGYWLIEQLPNIVEDATVFTLVDDIDFEKEKEWQC